MFEVWQQMFAVLHRQQSGPNTYILALSRRLWATSMGSVWAGVAYLWGCLLLSLGCLDVALSPCAACAFQRFRGVKVFVKVSVNVFSLSLAYSLQTAAGQLLGLFTPGQLAVRCVQSLCLAPPAATLLYHWFVGSFSGRVQGCGLTCYASLHVVVA
jgi:hypothetical protein